MKKHLIFALLLGCGVCALAQQSGDVKMVISGASSTLSEIKITPETKLSFDGGNLLVAQDEASSKFALTDITSISFAATISGTDDIKADLESLQIDFAGGVLTATATADRPITYRVYTVSGATAFAGEGMGTVVFDLKPLSKGIYIIKINEKVIKYNR